MVPMALVLQAAQVVQPSVEMVVQPAVKIVVHVEIVAHVLPVAQEHCLLHPHQPYICGNDSQSTPCPFSFGHNLEVLYLNTFTLKVFFTLTSKNNFSK